MGRIFWGGGVRIECLLYEAGTKSVKFLMGWSNFFTTGRRKEEILRAARQHTLRAATTLHLRVRDARTDDEFEDVQREVGEYLQTLNRGNYLAMPARLRTTQEMLDDALGPDESTETCDVSDE